MVRRSLSQERELFRSQNPREKKNLVENLKVEQSIRKEIGSAMKKLSTVQEIALKDQRK